MHLWGRKYIFCTIFSAIHPLNCTVIGHNLKTMQQNWCNMRKHTWTLANSISTSPIVLCVITFSMSSSYSCGLFNGTNFAKFRRQQRHVRSKSYTSECTVNIFFWISRKRLPPKIFINNIFPKFIVIVSLILCFQRF